MKLSTESGLSARGVGCDVALFLFVALQYRIFSSKSFGEIYEEVGNEQVRIQCKPFLLAL